MNIKKIIKEELDDLSWMDEIVPNQLVTVQNVYIGMRVKINEDAEDYYEHGDMKAYLRQSKGGQGTVISFDETGQYDYGWAQVKWDNKHTNTYQIGYDNTYSLIIVP